MYHYINDKIFLKEMRRECSDVINRLVQNINKSNHLKVKMQLVGSGGRNLVTQNGDEPIDLDYNLHIVKILDENYNEKMIKEYIRDEFNKILELKKWGTCNDSKSVLTTKKKRVSKNNKTLVSIDLAITCTLNNKVQRLIHEKTGDTNTDRWYWNEVPNSNKINKKAKCIKKRGHWLDLRAKYLEKKNKYLKEQDYNHPSIVCYIEAINEIYDKLPKSGD